MVRRIFQWFADGKSPRWIAGELNRLGIPSPGASWARASERLNAKRHRGWVATAIHGDRKRGTGILSACLRGAPTADRGLTSCHQVLTLCCGAAGIAPSTVANALHYA